MEHYIFKVYGYLLSFLSKILHLFVKPVKGKVLIGCSEGRFFNGNSKQLFQQMISQNKDVFFITRKRELYLDLKKQFGASIVYSYSFSALHTFLTSEIIVISHGVYDITPFNPYRKNKKVVNLWHGFTFKTIGAMVKGITEDAKKEFKSVYSKTSLMVSSSVKESEILSKSFGVDASKIKVTGYPRYDLLFEAKDNSILNDLDLPTDKKIILYAPTFRDAGDFSIFPFDDFSSNDLNKLLDETNSILLLRFHKNDLNKVEDKIAFSERIINFNQNVLEEVNEILPFVDLLITDYSSILMDFVIMDKPMMFFPYDIDEYRKKRGLNFDADTFYPGRVISSFNDFSSSTKLLLEKPETDKSMRDECMSKFHQYKKGNSTQAVIRLIEEL